MKVYAQDGHQRSDKITTGLEEGILDGVVYSSRYLNPEKASEKFTEALIANADTEIMLDSEFYASRLKGSENAQLGYLENWKCIRSFKRRDLVRTDIVEEAARSIFDRVRHLPVTAHIAPNIYISQSFDSMEAGIALNFIERAKECFDDPDKPVYATLAVDRRALLSPNDFLSFLNDITALESRPDGFYILIGGGPITERSDIVQSEIMDANVIGAWMMLNFSLTQNGFKVINGFADILTPFLSASGATACATGWWSNLRIFSMGRYVKPGGGGGQLPIIRYLSKLLLNRIKIDQLNLAEIERGIINGLPHDNEYQLFTAQGADAPNRTTEMLQTWETLASLNRDISSDSIEHSLGILAELVAKATAAYSNLSEYGISGGYDSNIEYLNQLAGSIDVFRKQAEID